MVVAFTVAVGGVALANDYEPVRPPFPQPGFSAPVVMVCRVTNPNTTRPGLTGSCTTGIDNLMNGETVQVTVGSFINNQTGGQLRQCTLDLTLCEAEFVPFTTGSQGTSNPIGQPANFNDPLVIPTPFTVKSTFLAAGGQPVDCRVTPCVIYATINTASESLAACHGLPFAGGVASVCTLVPTPTTTVPPATTSTSSTSTSTSTTVAPTTTSTSTSTTVAPTTSTSTSSSSTSLPGTTSTTTVSQCAQLQQARAQFNAQVDASVAAINASGLSAGEKAAVIAQLQAVRAQGNARIDQAVAACASPV